MTTRPRLRAHSQQALDWYTAKSTTPLALLGVVYLIVIVVPVAMSLDPHLRGIIILFDQTITLVFLADYLLRLWMAPNRRHFVRTNIFDIAVIIVPALRPLRSLRMLQFSTGTRIDMALIIVASTVILILVGGIYVLDFESASPDAEIRNYGDAVWWGLVTTTTVGYGDLVTVTVPGRVFAVVFMALGIALIGTVMATVSSSLIASLQSRQQAVSAAKHRVEDEGEDDEDSVTTAPPPDTTQPPPGHAGQQDLLVTNQELYARMQSLEHQLDRLHSLLVQQGYGGGDPVEGRQAPK